MNIDEESKDEKNHTRNDSFFYGKQDEWKRERGIYT